MPWGFCSACGGTGVVLREELISCSACEMTGKFSGGTCICCDGLGEQVVAVKAICPDCGGSGRRVGERRST